MSEPRSLFAKIHISKENIDRFLLSAPAQPVLDENWSAWWNSRKMYAKTELLQKDMYAYNNETNQAIMDGWKEAEESLSFSEYDLENEIWHFGAIFWGLNFQATIAEMTFIKSIASLKKDNSEDFAIIYDYFWGDGDVMAFLYFDQGKGVLDSKILEKADVDAGKLEYAQNYLTKKWTEFQAILTEKYKDD